MKRTKGLTFEQHVVLGKKLYAIRGDLFNVMNEINAYPLKDRVQKSYTRMVCDIDVLRSDLDSRLAVEHPEQFQAQVYYPGTAAQQTQEEKASAHQS
jgi:hypothetical protein